MVYSVVLVNSVLVGLIGGIVAYMLYGRYHIGLWAFLCSLLIDGPNLFLVPLGVQNLGNLLILTHTFGIFLFPIIMVILDILLIEIDMLRFLSPLKAVMPQSVKSLIKLEHFINRLEYYRIFPRPSKIQYVYFSGVIAGLINAGFFLVGL